MTPEQAKQQLDMLTLPDNFTGDVVATNEGDVYVKIDGPNDWCCMFSTPQETLWAQQQINAISQ